MFRCAAICGPALAFRNDVASFFEATAPADRAGRADTKMLGGPPTGQATINRGDHPSTKINMLTYFASRQLEADSRRFGNPKRFIPVGKCSS